MEWSSHYMKKQQRDASCFKDAGVVMPYCHYMHMMLKDLQMLEIQRQASLE